MSGKQNPTKQELKLSVGKGSRHICSESRLLPVLKNLMKVTLLPRGGSFD